MMADFALKCCRICGGDIQVDAKTCPLCSSRQHSEKKLCSSLVILVYAALGFLCIMLLGIMSAHAIQQVISSCTNSSNEKAMHDVSLAKIAVNNYIAVHGQIPENLGKVAFQAEEGVIIILESTSANSYRLISFHDQGDREYFVSSEKNAMYSRKKGQPAPHSVLLH